MDLIQRDIERFWKNVSKKGYDECWGWKGSFTSGGYGKLIINKKPLSAHRMSFFIHNGYLTKGKVVKHLCDKPECTNPTHLEEDTQSNNIVDMWEKGRGNSGNKKGWTKLKPHEIEEIRKLKFVYSYDDLAEMYKVSNRTIANIIRRRHNYA
jgi:DNA-binding transcriptional regulator YiaG